MTDDVVGIELQANWVDLTVSGGERGRKPLASANAANNCGEQYCKRSCASSPVTDDVAGIELQANCRFDGIGRRTRAKPLASANAANTDENRWLAPMRLMHRRRCDLRWLSAMHLHRNEADLYYIPLTRSSQFQVQHGVLFNTGFSGAGIFDSGDSAAENST